MAGVLVLEQSLNGLQFGLMLFLLAAGLTLVFGVMDMINLAHGSLYMVGAFLAAWLVALTGSFLLGVVGAVALTGMFGMALEAGLLRTLYARDHLSQVLATAAVFYSNLASGAWLLVAQAVHALAVEPCAQRLYRGECENPVDHAGSLCHELQRKRAG